jgi:hypothetical protein
VTAPPTTAPRARRVPWHPFLFAAIVVVTLWLDAAISPYAVIRSLVVALLLAGAITLVAGLLLRSFELGGVVASGVIGLLWSKQVIDGLAEAPERMGPLAIVWFAVIVLAIALVARLVWRLAPRIDRYSLTRFLNRAAGFLLAAALLLGFVRGSMAAVIEDLDQGVPLANWGGSSSPADAARPDIYAILLDGYPRADVLQYAFELDNTGFVEALTDRGFEVAAESHSDYIWTHVSVPSALNLEYVESVPAIAKVIDEQLPQQPSLRRAVSDNLAFQLAREHGYDAVGIGSGFEHVAPRRADVYVDGGQLNEFEISLLSSTFAGDIVGLIAPDFASAQQRDRILFNLESLGAIASNRDRPPAFVFAHVPAPHQPVVFGEGGTPVEVPISESFFADSPMERGEPQDEFIERYRAQLPYLNDRVLAAVDDIIAGSEVPPVILLFADHGSASAVDWNAADPYEVDPARLLERTGTLVAARTPDHDGVYPDDVSPADLLRLVFDAYWGTDYGPATPPPHGGQIAPVDASVLEAQSTGP